MNNKTLIATLLCMAAYSVSAQELSTENNTVECGRTGYRIPVTAEFQIKNKGTAPITISKVRTDCGCTQAELSKRILVPGEQFTLKLTYDAHMLGHYIKQAAIYSNDTDQPLYVKMQGVVLAEIQDYSGAYPYSIGDLLTDRDQLEFDDVNKGEHPQLVINLLNNSTRRMQPNIMHLPDYITATAIPEILEAGRHGKLVMTLNSEDIHDYGLTQTSVYIASQRGEKVNSKNEIPISIELLPDMSKFDGKRKMYAPQMVLSSEEINVGMIDGKMKKAETIIIQNVGRTALDISSVQMFTAGLKLTLGKRKLQPGESTKLKVTADRDVLLKARQKPRILMITNDPDHAKVVITINVK